MEGIPLTPPVPTALCGFKGFHGDPFILFLQIISDLPNGGWRCSQSAEVAEVEPGAPHTLDSSCVTVRIPPCFNLKQSYQVARMFLTS